MTKPQHAVRSKAEHRAPKSPPPCRSENGDHAALSPATIQQTLRHKPSIEPIIEPLAKTAAEASAERLKAFQGKQEPTEVIQNRIARRIGPEGWFVLGALTDNHRANLTTLERRGKLDDRTLAVAILDARLVPP